MLTERVYFMRQSEEKNDFGVVETEYRQFLTRRANLSKYDADNTDINAGDTTQKKLAFKVRRCNAVECVTVHHKIKYKCKMYNILHIDDLYYDEIAFVCEHDGVAHVWN
jgi:hypothetical protein